jgi:hypothetical protein
MKGLFDKIREQMILVEHYFHDQPYIVYNAFKYKLYDNKKLKLLAVNNNTNVFSDKVIHHFPGGPGIYENKIRKMKTFLDIMKKYNSKKK